MNKREQILRWNQSGHIKDQDVDKSLELTEATISPSQWSDFISKNLIIFGLSSLAIGIIFFLAYNWVDMTTLTKFALVQSLLGISALFYTQVKIHSHFSTALLFFVALLIGALLALFGQTYQTGKDPWQLFMLWTIFITPIAFISKNSSLWLLWLALLNLTLYLATNSYSWFIGEFFNQEGNVIIYSLVNGFAGALFYFILKDKQSNQLSLAFYVAMLATFYTFTWLGFFGIFSNKFASISLIFYLVWMGITFYLFRVKVLNVLLLSAWSSSAIAFIMFMITKLMSDTFNEGAFLILSLLLIGMTTFAIKWLMSLLKQEKGAQHE